MEKRRSDYRGMAYRRFVDQKHHCIARWIELLFTFDQWVAWWERHLGPEWMSKRGKRRGQYVMARHGDVGPYREENVACMTIGDNVREQAQIWKDAGRQRTKGYYKKGTKLTDKEVFEIFNSVGPQRQTAAKYGIHQAAVSAIKRGKMWRSLTSELRGDQGVL